MEEGHDVVVDIDAADAEDPQFAGMYVEEIFKYLRAGEIKDTIDPTTFLNKQLEITPKHRMVLVDWMVEASIKFRLFSETTMIAVFLLDRYLSSSDKQFTRKNLQLIGTGALFIASKYEETYPPTPGDFIWMTANTYTKEQLLTTEQEMLAQLNFGVRSPFILLFLRRFSKAALSATHTHTLSKYLCELSLMDPGLLYQYLPSVIAASSVMLARKMMSAVPSWDSTLEHYTGYKLDDLLPCCRALNELRRQQPNTKYSAVYRKYSSTRLLSVASNNSPVDLDQEISPS